MAPQKAVLPQLEAGPVPLAQIRAAAKKQLVDIIDSKRGKKALVLDPAISGSLTQLDAGLSELLTEHGIAKLLYLERVRLDDSAYNATEPRLADVRPVVYLARATLDNAQLIAWQVKESLRSGGPRHEFSVFWVPRRSVAVERVLEDEGVYGDLAQGEFALDVTALDDDVLSLELDGAFRECTLDGDPSSLFYTACALMKLQQLFGLIPRLQGKGPAAAAVRDMAVALRKELPAPPPASSAPRISRAVLIDREVDPITPLLTQITFEGLIDEVTGIRHGSAPYQPSRGAAAAAGGPAAAGGDSAARARAGAGGGGGSTLLNSSDPFYKEFRDLPYYVTSQRLQQYARDARREYAELGSKDISELKSFVKGLPKLLLLDRLSDLAVPVAEVVKQQSFHDRLKHEADILEGYDLEGSIAYVQELMWRRADPLVVLRLLCLLSCTCGGLPKKHCDPLRGEFLAAYGHQHLPTLNNLERAGLLKPQAPGSRAAFPTLRKSLRLVVQEQDPQAAAAAAAAAASAGGGQASAAAGAAAAADISSLHRGYAPLSIRLVEAALKGGWGPVAEVLSLLPGGQFDCLQVVEPSGHVADRTYKAPPAGAAASNSGGEPEVVLVVMLGGITFTEISALRLLSSQPEHNCRFLVLTTRIVNGRTLLESFVDPAARHVRKA